MARIMLCLILKLTNELCFLGICKCIIYFLKHIELFIKIFYAYFVLNKGIK